MSVSSANWNETCLLNSTLIEFASFTSEARVRSSFCGGRGGETGGGERGRGRGRGQGEEGEGSGRGRGDGRWGRGRGRGREGEGGREKRS